MVKLFLSDSGRPKGIQYPVGPLIYLDHFAVMNLADHWLDRFSTAFRRAEATLALSFINVGQLLKIRSERFERLCRLYRDVHHDYVFIRLTPLSVVEKENELSALGAGVAPSFLDNDLFLAFAATYSGKSVDPLDLCDSFRAVRDDPEHSKSVLDCLDRSRQDWAAMVDDYRATASSNPERMKYLHDFRFADQPNRHRPTYLVHLALGQHMMLNTFNLRETDTVNDFMQLTVPLSYAHFAVFDNNTANAARVIQRKLSRAKRLSWNAQVFSREPDLLHALENWDPDTANPEPYEPV